jgi:hypothetical protein
MVFEHQRLRAQAPEDQWLGPYASGPSITLRSRQTFHIFVKRRNHILSDFGESHRHKKMAAGEDLEIG